MAKRPVCLIIRDGWGMNPRFAGNSVFNAKTPVIDRLRALSVVPHRVLGRGGGPA